jgi:hypothetical protein|tara:strand:+ start:145 stop:351 length:207 start_codon:yes stop_codon:yes gene_type:complete
MLVVEVELLGVKVHVPYMAQVALEAVEMAEEVQVHLHKLELQTLVVEEVVQKPLLLQILLVALADQGL